MTNCYDSVIVGAGVIGLSLAYELSNRGQRTAIIDRQQPGREASWAGAGILPAAKFSATAPSRDQLCALSQQLHAQWAPQLYEQTGINTGYRRSGEIHIARDPQEQLRLNEQVAKWRSDSLDLEELDPSHLQEIEPALACLSSSQTVLSAYRLPDTCQVRNPRHVRALLSACQQKGVDVLSGAPCDSWEVKRDRVRAVQAGDQRLEADSFCLTAGVWSKALLQQIDIRIPLKPVRGQMALLTCPTRPFRSVITENSRYLVPRDDGRVLAGSTEDDVGMDVRTTTQGISGLLNFATSLVDGLKTAQLERCWAGLRPSTPDGLPILDRAPELENLYIATGHFRGGIHLSTGTAHVLATWITGSTAEIDTSDFSLKRFTST